MTPATRFARELGLGFPIVQAPMGGSAGGALAAAVANAGGLGMVGGGRGDHDWLTRELELVTSSTDKPWAIGFLAWAVSMDAIEHALRFDPVAVMFSFGDATPFAPVVRDAGVRLVVQVVDRSRAGRAGSQYWPRRYAARAVADRFVHAWKDREDDIGPGAKAEYMDAVQRGEIPPVPVWVNESVDLIHDVRPAGEVMSELVAGAIAAVEMIGHWASDAGDARTSPEPSISASSTRWCRWPTPSRTARSRS